MSLNKETLLGRGMTSLRTRQRLIERLTEKGISDVRVLEAMREIHRGIYFLMKHYQQGLTKTSLCLLDINKLFRNLTLSQK